MSSAFYYPTNTGSLGEARRVHGFTTAVETRSSTYGARSYDLMSARRNVLVVEDDENTVFLLKTLLGSKGYEVLHAWDGREAVEIAETEELDLVLLDLQLPRLSGLGVIHQLREKLRFESLPIVIMTGYEPERYRGTAIEAGCDDFLLKPIDFDRLDVILDYFAPVKTAARDQSKKLNSRAAQKRTTPVPPVEKGSIDSSK